MSRVSTNDKTALKDLAQAVVLAGLSGVSDASAITSAALTLTYTTDNPAYTPDGALTVADGDSLTNAEQYQLLEEMERSVEAMIVDITAIRTAVNNLLDTNVFDVSAPAALTSAPVSTAASTELVDLTITTDNPGITPDGTVTIADGDLTTAAEYLQYFIEWNAMARKVFNDISNIHEVVARIVSQKSFQGVSALEALTSTAGFLTVTYTTDNPSITPDGTITIADGDGNISVAERNAVIAEVEDQSAKVRADVAAVHATLTSLLAKAGIS